MKLVITGGLGFIGLNLLKKIGNKFSHIYVIDNLSTGNLNGVESLKLGEKLKFFNINLSQMDSSQRALIESVLDGASYVFHFASPCGVKYFDLNPNGFINEMHKMNQELMPLFAKYKSKVIFSSSSEVYGNKLKCSEDSELSIKSTKTLRWGYAANKIMSEILLNSYEIDHITLRFFNITGVGQSEKFGMVIPRFIGQAMRGEDLIVYGDGSQVRSFCDVRDAVNFISLIYDKAELYNQIFNVGNDLNSVSILELAKRIKEKFNSNSQLKLVDYNSELSSNSGDILLRSPVCERMNFYYSPQYSLDQILSSFQERVV